MSKITLLGHVKESTIDYPQLAREIFVKLRGSLSQTDLSQKLGYSFNQYGKWESGATIIQWEDFVKVNEVLAIDWKKNYEDIFVFHRDMSLENTSIFESLSRFFGYANMNEMGQKLHKSRSAISRLIHNRVKIHFADVLRVMDYRPFVLTSWLSKFLSPGEIEIFKSKYAHEIAMYKSIVSFPEAALVNSCFYLHTYWELPEHSNAWVASRVGITEADVETAIGYMLDLGLIYKVGNKYRSIQQDLTTLRIPEFRKVIQYVTHWVSRMYNENHSYTPNLDNPSIASLRVFSLSSAAGKEVIDALILFHHQVAEIVKKDQGPKDHVRTILLHCIDMGISRDVSDSAQK